jgi:uncharacterized protein YbjQ (UPF0145 family)
LGLEVDISGIYFLSIQNETKIWKKSVSVIYITLKLIQNMLMTTTGTLENKTIKEYVGIVSGETIIGANIFKDFFSAIRDIVGGRARSYEKVLRKAKEIALKEMGEKAAELGANGVIGIDLNYETVGKGMLMVTASGTAIDYE